MDNTQDSIPKTRVILVIGPPGSGKGTQCELLSKEFDLVHLSTGDACREMIEKKTDDGLKFESFMSSGRFIPDFMMIDFVMNSLRSSDSVSRGVLLDGFPRTLTQAHALVNSNLVNVERVILLQAPDEICLDRITSRRYDPLNGKLYNLKYAKPENDEISQRLKKRDTDKDETLVTQRLHTYHMNIGNILNQFQGKVQVVNGAKSVEDTHLNFRKILSEPLPEIKKIPKPPTPTVGQCVVCMSAPANYLVIPCGHQCGCQTCLAHVFNTSRKCPICRSPMVSIVRVFQSGVLDGVQTNVAPESENLSENSPIDDGGWAAESHKVMQNTKISNYEKSVSDNIKISISPYLDVPNSGLTEKVDVAINIDVPDIQSRVPVDVCCVIDVSGSMADDARFQDPNDETKTISEGYSVLDLVKHAVKTVMHCLTDSDRLAVATFDSNARISFPLSEMNESGQKNAESEIEKLQSGGSTNIWAGLEAGMNVLRTSEHPANSITNVPRKKFLLLLTDGKPNTSPPETEGIALKNYFDKFPDFKCQINTFGFGYTLQSNLLLEIAQRGSGTFSFIPDAKIIGTCFVNAVANICSNFCQNCVLHIMPKEGASFSGKIDGKNAIIGGKLSSEISPWGYVVKLGSLYYGQSRDFIFPMSIPPESRDYLEVTLEFDSYTGSSIKISAKGSSRTSNSDSVSAYVRNHVVDVLYDIIEECDKGRGVSGVNMLRVLTGKISGLVSVNQQEDSKVSPSTISQNSENISQNSNTSDITTPDVPVCNNSSASGSVETQSSDSTSDASGNSNDISSISLSEKKDLITGIYSDVTGRITKSVSTVDRFKRWGQHYLRSVARAHQLQSCTNFMDVGLQSYGGTLFRELKELGGKIFLTLPMKNTSQYREIFSTTSTPSFTNTNNSNTSNFTYYSGFGGGCFDEDCTVVVLQQSENGFLEIPTSVRDVKKNDRVRVVDVDGAYSSALVQCVVQIKCNSDNLVEFQNSGLKITQTHPIRVDGQWYQPRDLVKNHVANFEANFCASTSNFVYNFILDSHHILLVNGVECVTFGHGIQGPITWHPFYASHEVIDVVCSLSGYTQGFVSVHGSLKNLKKIS